MDAQQFQLLTLTDYWTILVRRKAQFFVPFVVVVALGAALALLLPPLYRSEATIMIERQSMPQNLIATTVTGYIQEQIEQTKQKIGSYDNLLAIAKAHQLYPEQLTTDPSGVTKRISEDIEVTMQEIKATDPDQRGERRATISFTVAFQHESPRTAQNVTNDLAKRYLSEHRAGRKQQAKRVSEFLDLEAEKLKAQISELENARADFKKDELLRLPELMTMNLRLFEKTEADIAATEVRIRETGDKLEALQAEISLTPAYESVETESGERLLSADKRLSALTAQYLRTSGRYSAKHPDVLNLAREIRMLAEQTGQSARADELLNELAAIQDRLRQLRRQYSDSHPEVRSAEQSVAAIQRGLQTAVLGKDPSVRTVDIAPNNPRYVSLRTQINATTSNLSAERAKLKTLNNKLDEYEERLYSTPGVERDFLGISLDYENSTKKYQEIKNNQMQARLAEQLEASGSAERFILLSAAFLPTLPDSPNRVGIILLAGLLAAMAGLGGVALGEYLDKTVRGERSLVTALGFAPLASIPNGAQSNVKMGRPSNS